MAHDRLMIRDVAGQLKAVRRVLVRLCDELGDLSICRELSEDERKTFELLCDRVSLIENEFHTTVASLEAMSTRVAS